MSEDGVPPEYHEGDLERECPDLVKEIAMATARGKLQAQIQMAGSHPAQAECLNYKDYVPLPGKPMPCISCGAESATVYSGRFFQIMLCDDCTAELSGQARAAIARCAWAGAYFGAECVDQGKAAIATLESKLEVSRNANLAVSQDHNRAVMRAFAAEDLAARRGRYLWRLLGVAVVFGLWVILR